MSELNKKLDSALGIDIEKIISDSDDEVSQMDEAQIQKYNEKREMISNVKQDLKDISSLGDRDWAKSLLRKVTENAIVADEVFNREIEDEPISRNITAKSELMNATVNAIKAFQEVDREERRIKNQERKTDLREKEININAGEVIDSNDNVIGVGSGQDILKMINMEADSVVDVEQEGPDATTDTTDS